MLMTDEVEAVKKRLNDEDRCMRENRVGISAEYCQNAICDILSICRSMRFFRIIPYRFFLTDVKALSGKSCTGRFAKAVFILA